MFLKNFEASLKMFASIFFSNIWWSEHISSENDRWIIWTFVLYVPLTHFQDKIQKSDWAQQINCLEFFLDISHFNMREQVSQPWSWHLVKK